MFVNCGFLGKDDSVVAVFTINCVVIDTATKPVFVIDYQFSCWLDASSSAREAGALGNARADVGQSDAKMMGV